MSVKATGWQARYTKGGVRRWRNGACSQHRDWQHTKAYGLGCQCRQGCRCDYCDSHLRRTRLDRIVLQEALREADNRLREEG